MIPTSLWSYTALALLTAAGTLAAPTSSADPTGAGTSSIEAAAAASTSNTDADLEATGYRYNNKILLFRHGEKRSDSSIGLSEKGKKRAQCLRKVGRPCTSQPWLPILSEKKSLTRAAGYRGGQPHRNWASTAGTTLA